MICEAFFAAVPAPPGPDDDYWYTPFSASLDITPDTALQETTVMACVRVAAETMAQLPKHLLRDDGRLRTRAVDDPLYEVLHSAPNSRHTSFEFFEAMQAHVELRGNAYALIAMRAGRLELIPLHPDRMHVFVIGGAATDSPELPRLGYLYQDMKGRQYRLTQDEVMHVRGLCLDGIMGLSTIMSCRRAIELSQQAEIHGLKWWKNAAKPGGVMTMPLGETLDDDAHARMKRSWRAAHSGEDLYTVAILEAGVDWKPMGISNEDSEWLESRRFQIPEICRVMRIPPHKVYSAIEHGHTYANVEQTDLDFLKDSMLPRIIRWEQAIKRDLISDPQVFPKFSVEGLLRADTATRQGFYTAMVSIGVLSINDVLELEDRNPVEGGDKRFIMSTLVPLEQAGMQQQQQPKPQQSEPPSEGTLKKWAADAIDRIVSAEIREVEKQMGRTATDRRTLMEWAIWYKSKHHSYVTRTLAPILAAGHSRIDASSMATELAEQALDDLKSGEPETVLNLWRSGRATKLTDRLCEDLGNGHG